ncbi:MAG: DUF4846 domain-containing protein [Sphingobacteriales bacterium]|nr:MAG: DUF4846 domain-containing protein [Sphingobacteriales bacterium]
MRRLTVIYLCIKYLIRFEPVRTCVFVILLLCLSVFIACYSGGKKQVLDKAINDSTATTKINFQPEEKQIAKETLNVAKIAQINSSKLEENTKSSDLEEQRKTELSEIPAKELEPKVAEKTESKYSGYPWLSGFDEQNRISYRIPPPKGYTRIKLTPSSFEEWLRQLPLKAGKPSVKLFDGSQKANQDVHEAVIDIDVGNFDLQQCADAVMRLRAEYLWSRKKYDDIHFNFTSGHKASYSQWRLGFRPQISGNNVRWVKTETAANSASYISFKQYLKQVFTFAGTLSLNKELNKVPDIRQIKAGDVFIKGGSPGHAVIVMDIALNEKGEKVFLLAQSYMPAQDIHILKNLNDPSLSPWYHNDEALQLNTPEWNFDTNSLKRFSEN